MKIFFIGTVSFSKKTLEKLLEIGENIVGVATKTNSGINADYADLLPLCEGHKIPCKLVNDINHPNNINFIKSCQPDIIFCFGWSNLIKEDLLSLCPYGIIGFHPAKLPLNRGRHPLIWALALGLTHTATTFFFMDAGADTGDILSQKELEITEDDDACSLYEKMVSNALIQIEEFIPHLKSKTYKRIKQNPMAGNTWRKRGKTDGKIDFRMNSDKIHNLVRALTRPYVGAHIDWEGQEIKVWKSKIEECSDSNLEPGKILNFEGTNILLKTADKAIWLLDHEFPDSIKQEKYL
jgi:methionyl-tRNA formyltransferase